MKQLFYPVNIMELVQNGLANIIFIPKKWNTDIEEMVALNKLADTLQPPKGGIMLPIPNGSISEGLNHSWSSEKGVKDTLVQGAADMIPGVD